MTNWETKTVEEKEKLIGFTAIGGTKQGTTHFHSC
jgi:hypothetical protein